MDIFRARGAVVLLANQAVSGTSYVIGTSVITRPFSRLDLFFASLSHNDAGSQAFRIELSGNGGGAYSSVHAMCGAVSAAAGMSGDASILNAGVDGAASRIINSLMATQGAGTNLMKSVVAYSVTGWINTIRLSPGASSFDQGTVSLIGWPQE